MFDNIIHKSKIPLCKYYYFYSELFNIQYNNSNSLICNIMNGYNVYDH